MDHHTLHKLKKGDRITQKQVYYKHADRLMKIVMRYTPKIEDGEEVIQDAFLSIFKKIKSFDPKKGEFEKWSNSIAVRHALMYLRKKKDLNLNTDDFENDIASTEYTEIESFDKEIESHVQGLQEKYRIVFLLKVVEGYSHKEIAEMLSIKTTNSRTIFKRAKSKLRKKFDLKKAFSQYLLAL